ncbi:hypothetical protein F5X97DRAFT_295067 [Nemania serpens]|nr:hypothetical protein F5X97DRAFT_295067 [Nemania serpens]
MLRFWPVSHPTDASSGDDCTHDDDDCPEVPAPYTHRVVFGAQSTSVYGYPSSGGALVLPFCNGVDLSFLGLSRFDLAEREEDPAKEDLHCARMRRLGAWWLFSSVHEYHMISFGDSGLLHRKIMVIAAWPQNGQGVWVVTMHRVEASEQGLARLWNASNMDERCEVVEKLGGRFYDDPALCPALTI